LNSQAIVSEEVEEGREKSVKKTEETKIQGAKIRELPCRRVSAGGRRQLRLGGSAYDEEKALSKLFSEGRNMWVLGEEPDGRPLGKGKERF